MKFLIIGLGNPGSEYEHTRHNIGFDILDLYANQENIVFTDARYGWIARLKKRGRQIICVKPSTYMNLSGNAVRYWMQQEKIAIENVLVIADDLNLEVGVLRMRTKGSHGGHNGLRSINDTLGSDQYARLRFGVGNAFEKGKQVNFVLGKWTEEEDPIVNEKMQNAVKAIDSFCLEGVAKAMNMYNG